MASLLEMCTSVISAHKPKIYELPFEEKLQQLSHKKNFFIRFLEEESSKYLP